MSVGIRNAAPTPSRQTSARTAATVYGRLSAKPTTDIPSPPASSRVTHSIPHDRWTLSHPPSIDGLQSPQGQIFRVDGPPGIDRHKRRPSTEQPIDFLCVICEIINGSIKLSYVEIRFRASSIFHAARLANKIYRIDDELSSAIQIFSNIADYSKDHGG